ncbi:MAG: TetR/AcrR family transcriptional regulator [Candidatus Thorarchaeota archaeon]
MRIRDQKKFDAVVTSSIELVNKLGFAEISMHKIAERAKISPGTIYIHFNNKNDLFEKIYIMIRENISAGTLDGIDSIPEHDVEKIFKTIWRNSFSYNLKHREYLIYREKFEQTPLMQNIQGREFEVQKYVEKLFVRGIKNEIIKDLPIPLLISFAFIPVITLG